MTTINPINFVLLKLSNRCNINCSYCYWFKDKSVYEGSKIIRDDVLLSFYGKLKKHIEKYQLKTFTVSLHGGEPLLVGKQKLRKILQNLSAIGRDNLCQIKFYLQTNGVLLDEDWIEIFQEFKVNIGVSIDGPKEIHDLNRKDLKGKPTFEIIYNNLNLLKNKNLRFGVLAVCNPCYEAEEICEFFVHDLGVKEFDILIPDCNYEADVVPQIKNFYTNLFTLWYEKYYKEGIQIRIAKSFLQGILGKNSNMQSVGYGPVQVCMIKPDGEIEALDFLHTLGYKSTKGNTNILTDNIDSIYKDDFWYEVYQSSLLLHESCEVCRYKFACGGGHISSRWSAKNRFNNPSIYCNQLYEIFQYVENYVTEKLSCYQK